MSLDSAAQWATEQAKSFEHLAFRWALTGDPRNARVAAELAVEYRAEARDLRGTAGIKYTGHDIYFEGATA